MTLGEGDRDGQRGWRGQRGRGLEMGGWSWTSAATKRLLDSVLGTSLVVQWLRLCAPSAGDPGSIPGRGTRSRVHAAAKDPACGN